MLEDMLGDLPHELVSLAFEPLSSRGASGAGVEGLLGFITMSNLKDKARSGGSDEVPVAVLEHDVEVSDLSQENGFGQLDLGVHVLWGLAGVMLLVS